MSNATPTAEEIQQVHAKTGEIHGRLKTDQTFRAQCQADPLGTLVTAGLPEAAAKELLSRAARATGKQDVLGYDYHLDKYVWYPDGSELIIRDWFDDNGVFLFEQYLVG